jgi:hypothetical protein
MRPSANAGRRSSFSILVDAIQYDLGPYLGRRGAGVWIEALTADAMVVGFDCPQQQYREELWNWLRERINVLVPAADRGRVALRDFSRVASD